MRLSTLNLLRCTRKDLEKDGELRLEPTKIEVSFPLASRQVFLYMQMCESSDFDTDFLVHLLPTIDVSDNRLPFPTVRVAVVVMS